MTIITYRNGQMACDSCWATHGTQTVSAIKIFRLASGALLGSAGDNDSRALIELLNKVRDPKKLPSRADMAATRADFCGLIAFPRGGVWEICTGPHDDAGYPVGDEADYGCWPATTMGGYAAVGSGADCALAAMDVGPHVTAKRAVEIACRRNIHCRLPVHVLRLTEKRK